MKATKVASCNCGKNCNCNGKCGTKCACGYGDYADPTPKSKNNGGCGGFQKPKGHMDSQMFPECKNTDEDRDVVKMERKRKKKKKSFNLHEIHQTKTADNWECESCGHKFSPEYKNPPPLCPMCGNKTKGAFRWDIDDIVSAEEIETLHPQKIAERITHRLKTKTAGKTKQASVNKMQLMKAVQDSMVWWENRSRNGEPVGSQELFHELTGRYDKDVVLHTIEKVCNYFELERMRQPREIRRHDLELQNSERTAGKKDKVEDFDVNPWAVCHTVTDKDKDPEKYERCVKKVKKEHRK